MSERDGKRTVGREPAETEAEPSGRATDERWATDPASPAGVIRHGIVEGEPGGTLPWPVWGFLQRVFRLFRRGRGPQA